MQQKEKNIVRRPCVNYFRTLQELKQLNKYPFVYWACPPDPGHQKPHVARNMKLDGYSKGNFDMTIVAANEEVVRVWLIEFKYGKNNYTPEQKAVAVASDNTPVNCLKIYSLSEFQEFLKKNLQ